MKLTDDAIRQLKNALIAFLLVIVSVFSSVMVDGITDFGEAPPSPLPTPTLPDTLSPTETQNLIDVAITSYAAHQPQDTLSHYEVEDLIMQVVSDYDMQNVGALDFGVTNFDEIEVEDLTASDDLVVTDDASVGGNLAITGNASVTGALTGSGTNTLDLFIHEQTELTATTTTITPTHTFYHLDSAAAVTLTLAASATEGQLLILYGDDNNTITIADTNIRTSDGNALTIGQYDAVMMIYDDGEWIQLIKIANQ